MRGADIALWENGEPEGGEPTPSLSDPTSAVEQGSRRHDAGGLEQSRGPDLRRP